MSSFQLWPSLSQSIRRRRKPSCNGKNIVTLKTFIMIYSVRYSKTPMGKKRAKILEGDDEDKSKDKGKKK